MTPTLLRLVLPSLTLAVAVSACGLGNPCAGLVCGDGLQCDPNTGSCVPAGSLRDGGVGGVGGAAGSSQSGSRIKIKVATTPDGARAALGWRDSLLQTDCAFGTASDGQLRCLPVNVTMLSIVTLYSNPSCTNRVTVLQGTVACPEPEYAVTADNSCPVRRTYYRVGAPFTGGLYDVDAFSNTCVQRSFTQAPKTLSEVPPGDFQSVTVGVE